MKKIKQKILKKLEKNSILCSMAVKSTALCTNQRPKHALPGDTIYTYTVASAKLLSISHDLNSNFLAVCMLTTFAAPSLFCSQLTLLVFFTHRSNVRQPFLFCHGPSSITFPSSTFKWPHHIINLPPTFPNKLKSTIRRFQVKRIKPHSPCLIIPWQRLRYN